MKILATFAISLLLGCLGGIGGTLMVLRHKAEIPEPAVRARSFELVDANGKTVSRWGLDQYHNPLLAFSPSAAMARPNLLGGELSLDNRDTQRVAIGLTGDANPFLWFAGNDNKPRATLLVSEYGKPVFSLYDENSWRVGLGVEGSDTPSPNDNDWGLDFYPNRASMGMGTTQKRGKSYVQGYISIHRDKVPFP